MDKTRTLEISVGIFFILVTIALIFLVVRVSGDDFSRDNYYSLSAYFENIAGLKESALVTISGVPVGRVSSIQLPDDLSRVDVFLNIESKYSQIPQDSIAKIMTHGVLGSKYIDIEIGFDSVYLEDGGIIEETQGSLVLEDLISKFLSSSLNK